MSRRLSLFGSAILTWTIAATASADPLKVTSGQLSADFENYTIWLIGSSFEVVTLPVMGFTHLPGFNEQCTRCNPGDVFDFNASSPGTIDMGHVRAAIDGASYPDLDLVGSYAIHSRAIVIPDWGHGTNEIRGFTAPFTFSAQLMGTLNGETVFSHTFEGSGTAGTGFFIGDLAYERERASIQYRFRDAAVPEPATLTLVGLALAGCVGRRRVRRATRA